MPVPDGTVKVELGAAACALARLFLQEMYRLIEKPGGAAGDDGDDEEGDAPAYALRFYDGEFYRRRRGVDPPARRARPWGLHPGGDREGRPRGPRPRGQEEVSLNW